MTTLVDNRLLGGAVTEWDGATVGSNAIIGKYPCLGDTNVGGQVTGPDYNFIDGELGLGVGNPLAPTRSTPEPRSWSTCCRTAGGHSRPPAAVGRTPKRCG